MMRERDLSLRATTRMTATSNNMTANTAAHKMEEKSSLYAQLLKLLM